MSKVIDVDKLIPPTLRQISHSQTARGWTKVSIDARNLNKGINQICDGIQGVAKDTQVVKEVAQRLIDISKPMIPFKGLYTLASTRGYGSHSWQVAAKKKALERHAEQLLEGREDLRKQRLDAVAEKYSKVDLKSRGSVTRYIKKDDGTYIPLVYSKGSKLAMRHSNDIHKAIHGVRHKDVNAYNYANNPDYTSRATIQPKDIYRNYDSRTKTYKSLRPSVNYTDRASYYNAEYREMSNNEYITERKTVQVNYKHKVTTAGRYKKGELAGNRAHKMSKNLPQTRTYTTHYAQRPPFLNEVDNTHTISGDGSFAHITIHNRKPHSKKFRDVGGEEYALAQYYHSNGSGKTVWNRATTGTSFWLEAAIGLHAPTDNYPVDDPQGNLDELGDVYAEALKAKIFLMNTSTEEKPHYPTMDTLEKLGIQIILGKVKLKKPG